jgi:Predicted nucleic acid-binding protein, contains PIN domain
MIIILDASAGIEIALGREKAKSFSEYLANASEVITSDLYKAETANAIWKYVNAKMLEKEKATKVYQNCVDIIDEYVDISENIEEAINESIRLKHPTYDLLYLTLARRNGAILLSLDKKLNVFAQQNGIEIVK